MKINYYQFSIVLLNKKNILLLIQLLDDNLIKVIDI